MKHSIKYDRFGCRARVATSLRRSAPENQRFWGSGPARRFSPTSRLECLSETLAVLLPGGASRTRRRRTLAQSRPLERMSRARPTISLGHLNSYGHRVNNDGQRTRAGCSVIAIDSSITDTWKTHNARRFTREAKLFVCSHFSGHGPLLLRGVQACRLPGLKPVKGSAAASAPKTLRGSFDQALRPRPSVVTGRSSLPFARPQTRKRLRGSFRP